MALNGIDYMGKRAAAIKQEVAKLPQEGKGYPAKLNSYVPRLLEHIAEN